ncbi:hypothetical protein [Kitasatospora sp. NPDC088783]|uniref:hypothetical protein n=1 Tax=Kitasatospora sp. NPDC088783 TaxID=3364077 RepID=UPI00380E53A8
MTTIPRHHTRQIESIRARAVEATAYGSGLDGLNAKVDEVFDKLMTRPNGRLVHTGPGEYEVRLGKVVGFRVRCDEQPVRAGDRPLPKPVTHYLPPDYSAPQYPIWAPEAWQTITRTHRGEVRDEVRVVRAMAAEAVIGGYGLDGMTFDPDQVFDKLTTLRHAYLRRTGPQTYRVEFGTAIRFVIRQHQPAAQPVPAPEKYSEFTVLVSAGVDSDGDPNNWQFIVEAPDFEAARARVEREPAYGDVIVGIDGEWDVTCVNLGAPLWKSGGWNRIHADDPLPESLSAAA